MTLAEVCVRRGVFAVMLISFLVVLGVFSFRDLGVDLFPRADPATVNVNIRLPGATPEEMTTQVVLPLEEALSTISGLDELTSSATEGSARITAQFVLEREIESASQDVREKVAGALRSLPPNILPPVIQKADPDADPVLTVVVAGDKSLRETTEIADKLDERPVRDACAIGKATAAENGDLVGQSCDDLAHQPGLADAGRARNADDAAATLSDERRDRRLEPLELVGSADERCVQPARVPRRRCVDVLEAEPVDSLALPLRPETHLRPDPNGVLDERVGRRADQDLARLCCLLQTLAEVDGIAGDEGVAGSRVPRDDLTAVDADPAGELDAPRLEELHVELGEAPLHLHSGPHRPQCVVLVNHGHAEDGHHLVAAKALHGAAVCGDDLGHRLGVARHHSTRRLGVRRLTETRRPHDVAEEHRDGLSHLERPRRSGRLGGTAMGAEGDVVGDFAAASRAGRHRRERRPRSRE